MKLAAITAQVFFIGLAISVSKGVTAQTVDWGLKSAVLEEDMTESQVVSAVGYRPNKVSLETCGSKSTLGAWTCKTYTYGNQYQNLTVLFRKSAAIWLVNSWFVNP